MKLHKDIRFIMGNRKHKYTAILPDGKRVHFGHREYEHYKDSVPKEVGGQRWSHKNHLDKERRKNYRKRHAGMMCKEGIHCYKKRYSPSWFSYYFLW